MALQLRIPRAAIPTRMQTPLELPSGQNLLGTTTPVSWDEDGILLTPRDEGLAITGDVQLADKDIVAGALDLPRPTCETCDETTDDSDDIDAIEDGGGKAPMPLDILSWYEKVSDSTPAPPSYPWFLRERRHRWPEC